MEEIIRIEEASRRIGRTPKWLRMAEADGRIPKAKRDMSNSRYYTEKDIEILREIIFPPELPYPLRLFWK